MIRFMRLPAVMETVGMSRSSIYRRIAAGAFPKPVPLGSERTVAWVESELTAWQQAQIAASRGADITA